MQRYFELRRSQTELIAVHSLLLLAIVIALIYLDSGLVQSIYLLAVLLLAIGEYRSFQQTPSQFLVVTKNRCGLVLDQSEQPYFFRKYKVYRCRWFAILKLTDRHMNRTEILFPDRFKSLRAYQECRFLLTRLSSS